MSNNHLETEPSKNLPNGFHGGSSASDTPKDWEAVEECLARAHELERRMPGGGKWPFATDAPWHLMQRSHEAGDYAGDGQDGVSDSRVPRPPLDAAEVAEHRRIVGWLQLIPDEADRKVVWVATRLVFQGQGREWTRIAKSLKLGVGPDAVAVRYRRALCTIVCRLRGWPLRRVKGMAA